MNHNVTTNKPYKNASDFRRALEQRLQNIASLDGIDLQRLRRQVALERLLARIFQKEDTTLILKGGYALEIRLENARATKDLDFMLSSSEGLTTDNLESSIYKILLKKSQIDLGDHFEFLVRRSTLELEGPPLGGARYSVEARMDRRPFVRFNVDVAAGDPIVAPIEWKTGQDWLTFAGLDPANIALISRVQHFAEKYHAYTRPRGERDNSRMKDLVDLVILIELEGIDVNKTIHAINEVFSLYNTHPIPDKVPMPPEKWKEGFSIFAANVSFKKTLDEAYQILCEFLGSH